MCWDFDPCLALCAVSPRPVSDKNVFFVSSVERRLSYHKSLSYGACSEA